MVNMLSWIPLVDYILSTDTVFPTIVIAIPFGLTLSLATISIGWVLFKPKIGVPLLLLSGVVVYFGFFHNWGGDTIDNYE